MCDLTIVLPSIRVDRQPEFFNSISNSIGEYSYEVIIVGPSLNSSLEPIPNCKFIKDFGSPARCAQIGMLFSEGEHMTWASDDGVYLPNALKECLDLAKQRNCSIIIRYSEGVGKSGRTPPDNYWLCRTHPNMHVDGISETDICVPVGLYPTKLFNFLGGFDCKFEHLNMNAIDLGLRIQRYKEEIVKSPNLVLQCDQMPGWTGDHGPVEEAFHKNDDPLFRDLYKNKNEIRVFIDYDNWKESESVWGRRFK